MSAVEILHRPQPVLVAGALHSGHLGAVIRLNVDERPVQAILEGIEYGFRLLSETPQVRLQLMTVPSGSMFFAKVPIGEVVEIVEPPLKEGRRRG